MRMILQTSSFLALLLVSMTLAHAQGTGAPERLPFEPEMVQIPGGTFMMGCVSDKACHDDEKPVHPVTISDFEIGKYEVTFAQWDACVQDGGCTYRPDDKGWGRGRRPVINVSWHDVQVYIRWLNKKTGKTYRLPTEAEWEYAARGDASGQNRTQFHFGDNEADLTHYGWYWKNADDRTHPVGRKRANGFGLHDMHGNVWEWVQDWYGAYQHGPQTNPKGPEQGEARVCRGGSWENTAENLRASDRNQGRPANRYRDQGFRLARTPTPTSPSTAR